MEENKSTVTPDEKKKVTDEAAVDEIEAVAEAAAEPEGDAPVAEKTGEDPLPSEFMNIEHFADYRKAEDTTVESGEAAEDEPANGITDEGEPDGEDGDDALPDEADGGEAYEYENLTILDEIEEEPAAESKEQERHESRDAEKYDEKAPRRVDARFDFVELFTTMMVVIMLLSAFVFRHSVVDGGSMEETLYDREHLIISNLFYEPKQYDIIVCEDYSTGLKKPIIKRVIATEGQTVRVESMDVVYVDGELVDTSFIFIDGEEELAVSMKYPIECVVPEGEVFVMGDHRNNSLDSRLLGTIDEDTILGKVVLRFYPFDRFGKVE